MKIQNPHDKFFKETFGNIAIAKDFLSNYLPQNIMDIIDINSLEPQKDSFINEKLQENFSDLLFKVNINKKEGYIYFLFEHKSYTSKDVALQLFKYMIEIWEAKINKEKADKLPIIIPLVIYHGKEKWNIDSTFGEMLIGYKELTDDIKKYIPDYEYLVYDISRYTDEEIKGGVLNKIVMTTFRDIQTKDINGIIESLLNSAEYIKEIEDRQKGIEYFEILIRYIFNAKVNMTRKDLKIILKRIENTYPEGSEIVMTLADILREEGKEEGLLKGMERGMEKGLEKGKHDERLNTALKLLEKKFGPLPERYKIKLSKLNAITLATIIDDIFDYKSLDDVKKYIN